MRPAGGRQWPIRVTSDGPRTSRTVGGVAEARTVYAARRLPDNGLAARAVVKERGYEGLVAKDAESAYP